MRAKCMTMIQAQLADQTDRPNGSQRSPDDSKAISM